MLLAVVACAVGFLFGVATGGRIMHLAEAPPRGWILLPLSGALGLLSIHIDVITGWFLSCLAVGVFGWMNRTNPGGVLVTLGAATNFLVVALNGGMPVAEGAAGSIGHPLPTTMSGFHQRLDHQSELAGLGDVIAIAPLGQVFSIGDLLLATGCALFVFSASRNRAMKDRAAYRGERTTFRQSMACAKTRNKTI